MAPFVYQALKLPGTQSVSTRTRSHWEPNPLAAYENAPNAATSNHRRDYNGISAMRFRLAWVCRSVVVGSDFDALQRGSGF